ncbi:hypothetical protein ACHAWF_008710, partial [Thalassiosira exigua]
LDQGFSRGSSHGCIQNLWVLAAGGSRARGPTFGIDCRHIIDITPMYRTYMNEMMVWPRARKCVSGIRFASNVMTDSPKARRCGRSLQSFKFNIINDHQHLASTWPQSSAPTALSGALDLRPFCANHPTHSKSLLLTIRRPVTSFLLGRSKKEHYQKPWHDPKFMQDSSADEVEKWLLSQIKSARRDAEGKRIRSSDSSNVPVVYFHKDFDLDSKAYLRVLEAHVRSMRGSSPQKAEYWVDLLERQHASALELFRAMYGRGKDPAGNSGSIQQENAAAIVQNLEPTVECYNALIGAWGNDKDLISVVRSRRWLSKLEEEAKNPNSSLEPNAHSYDLYLHSCSRGLGKHQKVHIERAKEAEEMLDYRLSPDAPFTLRPTTESFNLVIRAWTRCRREPEVAKKVMQFVKRMEGIYKDYLLSKQKGVDVKGEDWSWKQYITPNTKTYTMAMDGWIIRAGLKATASKSKQLAKNNYLKQISTNTGYPNEMLEEETKDDGTKEMRKAEKILKYIRDLDGIGHTDVQTTVIAYNIMLSGWARLANELRPDVPLKAERLLHDMIALAEQGNEGAAPDATSFNAVIKAWGRTKRPNSADRCEYWLRKMVDENHGERNFVVKPDVNTYNLVADAYLQLGDPKCVEDILVEMDGTKNVELNSEIFSKVIRAWIQDELNNPHKGLPGSSLENASNWLDELLHREKVCGADLGPAPDLFAIILKAAARTSARSENLLTLSRNTLRALKESRFPLEYTAYCWLLEVALKVLSSPQDDKRRREFVMSTFDECCREGLLSSKLVKVLSNGPFHDEGWTADESERTCKELFADQPLPSSWSRNLKMGDNQHPRAADLSWVAVDSHEDSSDNII